MESFSVKKIIFLLILLISVASNAKTVLVPRPFLNPEVTLLQENAENIPLITSTSSPYSGARSIKSAINVELAQYNDLEQILSFNFGGTNRGPWNRYVNVAILTESGEKISFPIYKSYLVGKGLTSSKINVWVKLNEICKIKSCDFQKGVQLYFFLDDFLLREIKPVYEWDHIIGVYYTLKSI